MALNSIYATAGNETEKIDVRLSYRIVRLFSEGLYASPNKAIEELVVEDATPAWNEALGHSATRSSDIAPVNFATKSVLEVAP